MHGKRHQISQFKCFQLHFIFERVKVLKFVVKLDKQCVKAVQIIVMLLTEDTNRSLPVKSVNKFYC